MSDANAPAPGADNAETAPNAEAVTPAPDAKAAEPTTAAVKTWRDDLPEDIRNDPAITKFETVEGLAKSYKNAQALIGGEKVPVPKGENEEDWNRWFKAAGRPDDAKGYGFEAPAELPEGMVYDEALDSRLAEISFKAGLNKRQAATVRGDLMDIVKEGALANLESGKVQQAENERAVAEATTALKNEWGNAFDQRTGVASTFMKGHVPPEVVAKLETAGLGNDPKLVKWFYDLGTKMVGEKTLIGEAKLEQSPGDLDSAIATHRSQYAVELMDKQNPDHSLRTRELTALYAKRFPEQAA